jgi:hypothetical protein
LQIRSDTKANTGTHNANSAADEFSANAWAEDANEESLDRYACVETPYSRCSSDWWGADGWGADDDTNWHFLPTNSNSIHWPSNQPNHWPAARLESD